MYKKYLRLFFVFVFFVSCSKSVKPVTSFSNPKDIYEEGLKLISEKEYSHALEYFQYIIDNHKDDEKYFNWALYEIGFIYYLKGDDEKAVGYFNEVLRVSKIKAPRILASLVKDKIEKGNGYKNSYYRD